MEDSKPKITQEMREQLRAPLPKEAIKKHPTKTFLSTIKAIYITERLNDVFGIGRWSLETEVISHVDSYVLMKGHLLILDYAVSVSDQYGGHKTKDVNTEMADGYKSAVTDVLSKTASYLEIGIDVFKGQDDSNGNTGDKGKSSSNAKPDQKKKSTPEFANETQIKNIYIMLTKNMVDRDYFKMYLSSKKQIGEDDGRLTMKKLSGTFAVQILESQSGAIKGYRKWESENLPQDPE